MPVTGLGLETMGRQEGGIEGGAAGRPHVFSAPPHTPMSPGRARATRTDGTRGSWRSARVTRHPGPNHPGTRGRCCLPPSTHPPALSPRPPAHPPAPLPSPSRPSIFPVQGPPGVKGEKGDHGRPGLQVVGQTTLGAPVLCAQDAGLGTGPPPPDRTSAQPGWLPLFYSRATPASRAPLGRLASRDQRWERSLAGRVWRWRLWWDFLLCPTPTSPPILPPPGPGWWEGSVSPHRLPGAGAGPGMDQPQPGTSTYPRQWWVLGVTVGGAPASAPPTPSFALRE